jgi:xanthine dehydrogenase accessory factor
MTAEEKLVKAASQLKAQGLAYALVTVVRTVAPTSAYVGAQAIVAADGSLHGWIGGGCAKGVVIAAAAKTLASGLPKLVRISNDQTAEEEGIEQHAMRCASNGTIELFIQPFVERPGLCVLGATPAADEARILAERLGIKVGDTPEAAPIVLVATQGEGDEAALQAALSSTAAHVLMIASPRKAERLRAAMLARGVPAERVASLRAPVGPDIGASTPAEIALAAVAEVVRLRRSEAPSGAATAGPPAGYVNPVCGAAITAPMVIHTLEHGGMVQYFCCDHCKAEFERDPDKYTAIAQQALAKD